MNRVVKNTTIYTIGNTLPKIISFILIPLYTKYLTPNDYGIVASMGLLQSIIVIIMTLSIERSLFRVYYDYDKGKRKEFLSVTFIYVIAFGSIITFLCLSLLKSVMGNIFQSIPVDPFYKYAILTSYFTIFSFIPLNYFMIEEKAIFYVILTVVQFTLDISLRIYFIVGLNLGARGQLLATMIASVVFVPVYLIIVFKHFKFSLNTKMIKSALSFSIPMIPTLLSAWIINLSDRMFIEKYYSMSDVGIYSLGYQFASIILIFTGAFNNAYNSLFYNLANSENELDVKNKLKRYNTIYSIIIILGSFLVSFFAKEIVIIFADVKYLNAYKIIPIISLAYLITSMNAINNLSIYQSKKNNQLMIINIVGAIINTILNYILIRPYGSYGAAYATVITFAFVFIIEYWYSKKCYFVGFQWKYIFSTFSLMFLLTILSLMTPFNNIWISLFMKIFIALIAIIVISMSQNFKTNVKIITGKI